MQILKLTSIRLKCWFHVNLNWRQAPGPGCDGARAVVTVVQGRGPGRPAAKQVKPGTGHGPCGPRGAERPKSQWADTALARRGLVVDCASGNGVQWGRRRAGWPDSECRMQDVGRGNEYLGKTRCGDTLLRLQQDMKRCMSRKRQECRGAATV